jgi:nitrate reductase molybdenum cofactor assembly chaperone NarJ/NarW
MKTFKALAALIAYPESDIVAAAAEIENALREERLVSPAALTSLQALFAQLRSEDLMDLQERYVSLFDRVRSLSLHLFEHVHGESRDRGQAMVDLRQLYGSHGYELATDELPDYLPAFLEFLSALPLDDARAHLDDTVHLLESIGARLAKRSSAYAAVFEALLEIAGAAHAESVTITDDEIRAEDDPAALDEAWREQPAFGPVAGCGGAAGAQTAPIKFYKGVAA